MTNISYLFSLINRYHNWQHTTTKKTFCYYQQVSACNCSFAMKKIKYINKLLQDSIYKELKEDSTTGTKKKIVKWSCNNSKAILGIQVRRWRKKIEVTLHPEYMDTKEGRPLYIGSAMYGFTQYIGKKKIQWKNRASW